MLKKSLVKGVTNKGVGDIIGGRLKKVFAEILYKGFGLYSYASHQLKYFHMAFSKHHLYDPTDQITGGYAHAFSHAARILIIKQLLKMGPTAVQLIAQDHPIHKESLSGHIKILRHYDLVEWEESYPYTYYSVHDENLKKACRHFSDFLEIIKSAT